MKVAVLEENWVAFDQGQFKFERLRTLPLLAT